MVILPKLNFQQGNSETFPSTPLVSLAELVTDFESSLQQPVIVIHQLSDLMNMNEKSKEKREKNFSLNHKEKANKIINFLQNQMHSVILPLYRKEEFQYELI